LGELRATCHLHWTEHVKRFPRRQFVARQLGAVGGVVVSFVIVEKAALARANPMRTDQVAFYNSVSGLILEETLRTASTWPDGARDLVVSFGHVRGFPHQGARAAGAGRAGHVGVLPVVASRWSLTRA